MQLAPPMEPASWFRPQAQACRARRFQGVHHVKQVRPGFRPILPRMHGRIRADEALFPIRGRSLVIVPVECLLVVRALISEELSERIQLLCLCNQTIPIIVTYLVSEVSEQGAIRLMLPRALLLAFDVVRFGDVDGDQSVVMAREDSTRITVSRVLEKFERQSRLGLHGFGLRLQT